jgi:hypothetical protein
MREMVPVRLEACVNFRMVGNDMAAEPQGVALAGVNVILGIGMARRGCSGCEQCRCNRGSNVYSHLLLLPII